jgi:hypothetical protein
MNPFSDNRAQLYHNENTVWLRILVVLIGLVCITLFPWWINGLCMILMVVRYRAWEVLIFASAMDVLYAAPSSHIFFPWCTAGALALLWVCEPLRRHFL